jgi:V/A-type H+-transporting ATPase subunit A
VVKGKIVWVSGPAVKADGMSAAKMYETVEVGDSKLIGEVIRLTGDVAFIQVYESTSGLRPGESVTGTGQPLSVLLGPGIMGKIYDGIQRPLDEIAAKSGAYISRGVITTPVDMKKKYRFKPSVKKGDEVGPGSILGTVEETPLLTHSILAPPNHPEGKLTDVSSEGDYNVDHVVATSEKGGEKIQLKMYHRWPVRKPRPYAERYDPTVPLITGQRIIDIYFPIAKGGTGAIPGGFGTGKCVLPDTPVLLADGSLIKIKDLFTQAKGPGTETGSAREEFVEANDLRVLAFDGLRLLKSRVSHLYRGFTDRLVKIKTSSGREIAVTPAHKLIVFNPSGYFEERPAEDLKKGDYLTAPRKLPVETVYQSIDLYSFGQATVRDGEARESVRRAIDLLAERSGSLASAARLLETSYDVITEYRRGRNCPNVRFVKRLFAAVELETPKLQLLSLPHSDQVIRIPEIFDDDFAEFFGLILSDGMVGGRQLRFFNNDPKVLHRFTELVRRLFGLEAKPKRFRTVDGAAVNNVLLIQLLRKLGYPIGSKSRRAAIPSIVMRSPNNVVAAFLRGYYIGDGSFSKGVVEITSASRQLVADIGYALGRLGILYTVTHRGERNHRLIISSQKEVRQFLERVGGHHTTYEKFSKIESYSKEGPQTRDVIPLDASVIKKWTEALSRGHFEKEGIWIKNYTELEERMGVKALGRLSTILLQSGITTPLHQLSQALEWVFLDQIQSVTVEHESKEVYDLVVPGPHNFVGGELPCLLHNTVTLHQIAKWADSKVVVYIGCGERGNEMTEVLVEFPHLIDPRSGRPLMERTVLVANTSNMPVAAREASIYTGVTIAEYYRDMGFDVVLVADSTSRWAEALREMSGRLEEMPAEEGYPSYLASRLAEFYERAGRVRALGSPDRAGSVTLVGAVSPSGADFTEPVTTHTIRFIKTFWALDTRLAYSRHYPSINWMSSYSGYLEDVSKWWKENVTGEWFDLRAESYHILQREDTLKEIVRLLGPEALPDEEKLVLELARMIKIGILQQNSFDKVDTYCSPQKQVQLVKLMVKFYKEAQKALKAGVSLADIRAMPIIPALLKAKFEIPEEQLSKLADLDKQIDKQFGSAAEAEVKVVA